MNSTAFDKSSCPVATVDFEYPDERRELVPGDLLDGVRADALDKIRAYFQREFTWAAQGRTLRARMIRLALLRGDESIHDLAARFNVSEHDVRKHRRELLKLRARVLSELNDRVQN